MKIEFSNSLVIHVLKYLTVIVEEQFKYNQLKSLVKIKSTTIPILQNYVIHP